ncbi:MAG: formate dehydrogenase subunit gamma [Rhodospirillales bacterium]|nr:formate dehydrogenase subunit gamma [Rhodospirillales bacterium]
MAEYERWSEARTNAIIAEHAGEPGAILPILHALQEVFGHVPVEAEPLVAAALNLSRAEVHGIVTFYHDFRRHAPGRHVLRLCRAEACQAAGGDALATEVRRRHGIDWHATTPDGALTLEPVFCLGLCACAPAAMLDGQVLGRLDEATLDEALGGARERAA